MSARLLVAGRLPQRAAALSCAPIASAERLAWFVRDVLGGDVLVIESELRAWRDREGVELSEGLLTEIARQVAVARGRAA